MSVNDHFKGKSASAHITERLAQGVVLSNESHGVESPGHYCAIFDSLRNVSLNLMLLLLCLEILQVDPQKSFSLLLGFSITLTFWKTGRSSWLAWSRLERLHRLLEQERHEIENHRDEEREELAALYQLKGFDEPLLSEVVDVLMSDNNRLLQVMLEEELGLTLGAYEHPLKQGLGSFLGSALASFLLITAWQQFSLEISLATGLLLVGGGAYFFASFEKNRALPATVWNLSLSLLCLFSLYYLLAIFGPA